MIRRCACKRQGRDLFFFFLRSMSNKLTTTFFRLFDLLLTDRSKTMACIATLALAALCLLVVPALAEFKCNEASIL